MIKCLNCSKQTNNPKFCSRSCSAIINNIKYPKRIPEKHICIACGIDYTSKDVSHPAKFRMCAPCKSIKIKEDIKNKRKLNSFSVTCSDCNKQYFFTTKGNHGRTKCNSCRANGKRHNLKIRCVEYKGGKCQVCNYDKNVKAMDFHHLDSSTKDFSISAGLIKRWKLIVAELDKCILLCCRCHREYHAGELNLPGA